MGRRSAIAILLLMSVALHAPVSTAAPPQQAGGQNRPGPAGTVVAGTPYPPMPGRDAAMARLDDLDGIVAAAMAQWSVPGVALAVVADGKVILSKGYGYRHAESGLPVTPETLFPIASLTKPLTATLLAALVDDGVLEWDRPVIEYLPDFRLKDEALTRRVTPRDLVTHQSGLPRHDFVWYGADLSTHDLYERLQFLEPSRPLRGGWQYQNLMFMTAGYLAEQVTGSSWEQLVRERIFEPLNMREATFSLRQLKQSAHIAFPYGEGPAGARRVPFRSMDAVGPAGSINATVDELARFVLMHLDKGTFEGRRVVSAAVAREMLQPQVQLPPTAVDPALGDSSYGLGLVLSRYGDHRLAHHEGGVDGFVSLLSFLPDDGIGVVVLTNYSGDNPVPWVITRSIYDRLLGQPPRDWIAYAHDTATLRGPKAPRVRATPVAGEPWRDGPYQPMSADYAGTYWHPAYGEVDIVLSGNELMMRFHGIDAMLEAAGDNRFRVKQGSLRGLRLTFLGNAVKRIDRVAIPWEPEVSDIVFVRRATADGHDESDRRR